MESRRPALRVLVLGATGLIGQAATRALLRRGHAVRGVARRAEAATRSLPQVSWHYRDIAALQTADDWQSLVLDCDAILNLAGALQDGGRDRLMDIHARAITALVEACPSSCRVVHISVPGASHTASTAFYRSKALGDEFVKASRGDWVILRPVVVLGRDAFGGSALLRALAAFPGFIPVVHGETTMQTVALDDVVDAICIAVERKLPSGSDLVLSGPDEYTLAQVLATLRQWFGLAPAPTLTPPLWVARAVSCCADAAGHLGWRSPLRSTSITISAAGVVADAGEWTRLTGHKCKSLEETLALMPATVQERWFARMYLLKPLIIGALALFWFLSGIIGLLRIEIAAAIIMTAGLTAAASEAAVVTGAVADMALGALVLHQRTMPWALTGMIAVTGLYLVAATILVPALWLDPLGPLLKLFPALVLTLVALAVGRER